MLPSTASSEETRVGEPSEWRDASLMLRLQHEGNPNALSRALMKGQLAHTLMKQDRGDERADTLFRSAVSMLAASLANNSLGLEISCFRQAKLKARHKDWRGAAGYAELGVKIDGGM
jgi:hypothetical protein